jgi:hypothetical protein
MYAGIAPQQDFFLYVPLVREEAIDLTIQNILPKTAEQVPGEHDTSLELSTWTKIILPALTIYTHHCGEERESQLAPWIALW